MSHSLLRRTVVAVVGVALLGLGLKQVLADDWLLALADCAIAVATVSFVLAAALAWYVWTKQQLQR